VEGALASPPTTESLRMLVEAEGGNRIMRARRIVAAIVEVFVAIIMSFLFAQVAARVITGGDDMAKTLGTIGAYSLGIIVGVFFSAEILDVNGNFWFLVLAALFSGIVMYAAYDFEPMMAMSFQDAIVEYLTSITVAGPILSVFAFNIGPKSYGTKL
jgi:hypothetical protein